MRIARFVHVGLATLASASAQEISFVDGDPSSLSCRVVALERNQKTSKKWSGFGTTITVEVRNRGTHSAEPVGFLVRAKKDRAGDPVPDVRVARFPGRVYGRAGRAVAPGEALRYAITSPHDFSKASKVTVEVTDASWFDGAAAPKPDVTVRGLTHERYTFGNINPMNLRKATCSLRNPLADTVDLAFRLTLSQPYEGAVLATTRLEPARGQAVGDRGDPARTGFGPPRHRDSLARTRRLERAARRRSCARSRALS